MDQDEDNNNKNLKKYSKMFVREEKNNEIDYNRNDIEKNINMDNLELSVIEDIIEYLVDDLSNLGDSNIEQEYITNRY